MRIRPLAVSGGALLLLCFQAVLAQSMDISIPPEDQDSSGDDYESFSGSGEGPLREHRVVALNVPLQGSTNTSLKPEVSTDLRDTQPEVEVTNSPVENYSTVPLSTASISEFPTNDLESSKPAIIIEDEYVDSVTESETTRPMIVTAGLPITHNTASTVKIIEHNYHYTSSVSSTEKTSTFDMPASKRNLNPPRPSTEVSTVQTDSFPLFEKEAFPSEDGSGGQEDFTFSQMEENPINVKESGAGKMSVETEAKDAKSEGAPQGIMDRKEVLGGVIAGGLVGLLFAGFLVGFMLYRMKKKDEGSYSLDEPKQSNGGYQKPHKQEEFYA